MESAALAIAIVSAVGAAISATFAGLAVRHARRSADEAKRVADIDEDRRHEERVPKITARFGSTRWVARQTADYPVVWFDLVEAPEQLTGTRVELVLREEATETPILEIAPRENDQLTGRFAELSCPFVPGEERLVIATLPPNRPGGVAAFNVTCRILSGETWTVQVRCEIPQPPMIA